MGKQVGYLMCGQIYKFINLKKIQDEGYESVKEMGEGVVCWTQKDCSVTKLGWWSG